MSNEIKENGAAATVVETSPTTEEVTAAAKTVADKKGNTKPTAKGKAAKAEATGAFRAVGLAACKRHGLKRVWVTDDCQCFAQENDARAHGKNLANPEILKVEAE